MCGIHSERLINGDAAIGRSGLRKGREGKGGEEEEIPAGYVVGSRVGGKQDVPLDVACFAALHQLQA